MRKTDYLYLSNRQVVIHNYTKIFINRANYTTIANMSISTQTQKPQEKVLTPTQQKIAEIQKRANAEKAKIRSDGFHTDLVKAVRDGLKDDQLYPFVTAWKNNQDKIRKLTGVAKPRKNKGEKSE